MTRNKTEPEPSKTDVKDSRTDDEAPLKGDADEGSSTAPLRVENVKQEHHEEQDSKDNSG